MLIRLRVRAREGLEYSWESRGREIVIGRGHACALRFDAPASDVVSWEHARMEIAADGASIIDLGSSNGTFVNGARIREITPLKPGDRVTFGRSGPMIEVEKLDVSEQPPSTAPPAASSKSPARAIGRPPIVAVSPNLEGAWQDKSPVDNPSSPLASPSQRSTGGVPSAILRRLDKLQRGQRIGVLLAGGLLACLLAGAAVALLVFPEAARNLFAAPKRQSETKSGEPATDLGKRIFSRLIHSVVCVVGKTEPKSNELFIGSGALVDRDRRLILTNAHLARHKHLVVYFPQWRDGRLMTDLQFYAEHGRAHPASVLRVEPEHDLALLEIDELPPTAAVLPLAAEVAAPGDTVHSIGNPPVSGAMWIYSTGTVRQVCRKKHVTVQGHPIDAQIIITQVPINQGDSGSAVVNNLGQLVGVNYASEVEPGSQNITYAIELSEVRALLQTLPPQTGAATP